MIPRSASYANRFKSADRHHVEQIKEAYIEERADILARSRRLQLETNRRRKALTVKRKLEAAKEEKRRQEILARRREQQNEATQRFQRLGKPRDQLLVDYQYKHPSKPSPALEEALRTVSGRPSHFVRQNSRETPILEDALQAVRGSPGNYRNGIQNGYQRQNSAGHKTTAEDSFQYKSDRPLSGSFRDRPPSGTRRDRPGSGKTYSQSTMGPNRIQEHAREIAARTDLQSRSLRQTSNSRSLFEQQIEQQQSLLIEQQKISLHHFNAAIQKEMDKDAKLLGTEQEERLDPEKEMNGRMVRSDSLSSVDSLEMSSGLTKESPMSSGMSYLGSNAKSNFNPVSTFSGDNPGYAQPPPALPSKYPSGINSAWSTTKRPDSTSPVTNGNLSGTNSSSLGGFVLHRSPSNPTNIAVVSPSIVHNRNDPGRSNVDSGDKPSSVKGTMNVGSFTPNRDSPKGPSITGYDGDSRTKFNENSGIPSASEAYNVIKTSSNGRANAHYYQDSVVNNDNTFVLHPQTDIFDQSSSDMKETIQSDFDSTNNYSSKQSGKSTSIRTDYKSGANDKPSDLHSYSPANYTDSSSPAKAVNIPLGFGHMAYLPHPPNASAPSTRSGVTMADMRASSIAGNVNTNHYEPMNVTEELSHLYEGEVVEEKEEPEEETYVEPAKPKVIKGILKKTKQPASAPRVVIRGGRVHSATTYTAKLRAQGRGKGSTGPNQATDEPTPSAAVQRPASSSSSVKDSIEVARDQLSARKHTPQVKKRSIRWADMTYSDDDDENVEEKEIGKEVKDTRNMSIQKQHQRQEPIINAQSKIPTSTAAQKHRPFSAKFSTNTPQVESSMRAASAGQKRQPFIRPSLRNSIAASRAQTANNWASNPPNSNVHTNNRDNSQTSIPKLQSNDFQRNQDKLSSSVTAADIRKSLEGAVYDVNGMRLDRTPTDEEINWLWDKVRTCLSRQSTMDNTNDDNSERGGSASTQPRQAAQVSNKYIDGTSLTPQLRTSRVYGNHNGNTNTNDATTYTKKKISMDTLNTFNRKSASSGALKRSPSINNGYIHNHISPGSTTQLPYNAQRSDMYQHASQQPAHSYLRPTQSPNIPVVNGYNEENISESMAEFLAAEEISAARSGSITDSQLRTTIEQRRQNFNSSNHPQRKVMSALSLEEQKLLQSLERLNDRLQVIEDHDTGNKSDSTPAVFVPRPPQHRPGFKGHSPISGHRRYSASPAGVASRRRFQMGSARLAARAVSARYQ